MISSEKSKSKISSKNLKALPRVRKLQSQVRNLRKYNLK